MSGAYIWNSVQMVASKNSVQMGAPNLSGTLYRKSGASVVDRPETPESPWCQGTELPKSESKFAIYYYKYS